MAAIRASRILSGRGRLVLGACQTMGGGSAAGCLAMGGIIAARLANMQSGHRTDLQPSANLRKVTSQSEAAKY
jgi:hypothetical protein